MNNELKNEIQKRFEILEKMGLMKIVQKEFWKDNLVYYTLSNGALYWCNKAGGGERYEEKIKEFEKQHKDTKVYYTMVNYTEFGELLTLLYVSGEYPEEWEQEKEDLQQGYAFGYVYNLDCDWCSEFGSVGIAEKIGGIVRV